jgi:hypothetical protein
LIRGLQNDGQKIKPLIFGDEVLILGVEWKKITFLTGGKALILNDFGEYFYNLGITAGSREWNRVRKPGADGIIIEAVVAQRRYFT